MTLKLQTEHDLKFIRLKGGCIGSPESTLVSMPHCWKSHVAAHLKCQVLHFNVITLNNNIDIESLHFIEYKVKHCYMLDYLSRNLCKHSVFSYNKK